MTGTMAESTAASVLKMINENGYVDGDRLPPERDLAMLLGVSRTTVREALKRLSAWGFIHSVQGGGNYVSLVSSKTQIEFLDVRRIIECETAKLAAENIGGGGNAERQSVYMNMIRASIKKMKQELEAGEYGVESDEEFHMAVARAAGNGAMCTILEQCCGILNAGRYATLTISGQGEKTVSDHERIADAIESGKAQLAAEEMRNHIEKAKINILMKEGTK